MPCRRPDRTLALRSCLSGCVGGLTIPAMLMLTACMPQPPSLLADHDSPAGWATAGDRHDFRAKTGGQPLNPSSRSVEDDVIDTRLTYDLPALVDLALHAHPETKISWENAKAAAARLERNRSSWYPTLTAMAFGQSFKTSFPIPGGPLVSHGYAAYGSLDLAWTLFDFGRREALVNAGDAHLSEANFAFDRTHQDIAYRVASSFFSYQAALAKVTAAQQTFEAAKANATSVQAKLDRGLATKPDLLLAIQEQAKASYDHQDARGAVTQIRAELMTNLGISPAYSLQLIDLTKLPLPVELEQSVEKIIDQALQQRPDLMARLAELRAREADVKKARADFWPKISLRGMVGNQYWGNVHTNPPGNQTYSGSNLVDTAMLNVEWTLFDGFERSNAVHEAEAKQQASKARLEALRLEIMRDIWKAYADTKTSLEKREFALALLKAAEESYAATRESYHHGFSTVIELLSAQKDLARARYTEIDSRAALLHSAATLVYVSGGENREDLLTDRELPDEHVPR
ncbi:MAG: TolC family protein [Methylococcales bacterium]|nr:TolC family protein [Methylococcales bacterium]